MATAASYLVSTAALYVFAQRLSFIPYELGKVLAALAVILATLALASRLDVGNPWLSITLKVGLVLLYGLALVLVGVLPLAELRVFANVVLRRLRSLGRKTLV